MARIRRGMCDRCREIRAVWETWLCLDCQEVVFGRKKSLTAKEILDMVEKARFGR